MTRVLVTGATGYIGGRLVPQLLEAGHEVSVYARSAWKLRDVAAFGSVMSVSLRARGSRFPVPA